LMPILEDDDPLPFVHTQKERLLHHMLGKPADDFLKSRYAEAGDHLETLMEDVVAGI